ncbi:hypothetical protein BCA37_17820 [Mycobacterium sp. djl-10]|nr:hypothetical protein BCA37_17820 [Mycobacterium sp. djl-10]
MLKHSAVQPSPPRAINTSRMWWLLATVVAVLVLGPLVALQTVALSDGAYGRMIEQGEFGRALTQTLQLGAGSALIGVAGGLVLAFAAWRLPRNARFLTIIPLMPLLLPAIASVVGWSFLFSPRVGYGNQLLRSMMFWSDAEEGPLNIYSMPGMIVVTGMHLVSFVYIFCYNALTRLDGSLVEAAQVSGATGLKRIWTVALPLLRPALVFSGAMVFIIGLGTFNAPLLLNLNNSAETLTIKMYDTMQFIPVDYGLAAAYGSPLILLGIALVLLQQRMLRSGERFQTTGARGGVRSVKSSWSAAITITVFGLVAVVLPMVAVVIVAFSPFWSEGVSLGDFTTANFVDVLTASATLRSIENSVYYTLGALILIVPISYLSAMLLVKSDRSTRFSRKLTDVLVNTPLTVPAVIFGAGLLIVVAAGPVRLYGSPWSFVLAYAIIGIPFVTRMLLSAMLNIHPSFMEAARTNGAPVWRSHLEIMVPMIRPALGAGVALILTVLTQEFPASVMLHTSRTEVMGTQFFKYWDSGYYPNVAVMAVVMCVVTGLSVAIAMVVGGQKSLSQIGR